MLINLTHGKDVYTFRTNCINEANPNQTDISVIQDFFSYLMNKRIIECAGADFTNYNFRVAGEEKTQPVSNHIRSTAPEYTIEKLILLAARRNDINYPKILEHHAQVAARGAMLFKFAFALAVGGAYIAAANNADKRELRNKL